MEGTKKVQFNEDCKVTSCWVSKREDYSIPKGFIRERGREVNEPEQDINSTKKTAITGSSDKSFSKEKYYCIMGVHKQRCLKQKAPIEAKECEH